MVNVDKINEIIESLQKDSRQLGQISRLCSELNKMGEDIRKSTVDTIESVQRVNKAVELLQQYKDKQGQMMTMLGTATADLERCIKLSEEAQADKIGTLETNMYTCVSAAEEAQADKIGTLETNMYTCVSAAKDSAIYNISNEIAKKETETRVALSNVMAAAKQEADLQYQVAQAERKKLGSLCKVLLVFAVVNLIALIYLFSAV